MTFVSMILGTLDDHSVLAARFSLAQRKPSYEYVDHAKAAIEFGSWTTMEMCILSTTESYIASTCIAPTTENIQKLYNFVVKSMISQKEKGSSARVKSLNQVRAKLLHKREREEAFRGFLGAVKYYFTTDRFLRPVIES